MKNVIIIFVVLFNTTCLNAQSVVFDITESELGKPEGYYSKDMNNLLNQFEGTYVYTNGNKVFTITLVKKIKQYNSSYYEDLIIGEYQYSVNGTVIQNTMPDLNIVYNNQFIKHAIGGRSIIGNGHIRWKCPQCNPNEKRLRARIRDVNTERLASFFMRRTVVNGQQVLQVKIDDVLPDLETANPPDFSLPLGEFTMIKQ